jgi:site-specific DNA recombinase
MTQAVGLVRVSTQEQAREGLSLEMQQRRIAGECASHGWDLVRVYSEEGVSGAAAQRELVGELLHHISIEPGGAVHLSIRQGA